MRTPGLCRSAVLVPILAPDAQPPQAAAPAGRGVPRGFLSWITRRERFRSRAPKARRWTVNGEKRKREVRKGVGGDEGDVREEQDLYIWQKTNQVLWTVPRTR